MVSFFFSCQELSCNWMNMYFSMLSKTNSLCVSARKLLNTRNENTCLSLGPGFSSRPAISPPPKDTIRLWSWSCLVVGVQSKLLSFPTNPLHQILATLSRTEGLPCVTREPWNYLRNEQKTALWSFIPKSCKLPATASCFFERRRCNAGFELWDGNRCQG